MSFVTDAAERASLLHRGSLDLCVLAVLREQPRHAYGIVQLLTDHDLGDVSYGTIYPLVTRLRRLGLLEQTSTAGHGGPARNVLSLTPQGRAALQRWAEQWHRHQDRVSALLDATTPKAGRHDAG